MISEMSPPSRSSSMVAAPPPAAVAPKADRRKNSALAKAAKDSANIVNAFIRGQGGQSVNTYSSIS